MSLSSSERLPDDAMAILLEYQRTECAKKAEWLIKHYEPMVKVAANKMSRNRPDLAEDLFQIGQLALFRLLTQFDPGLGMPFEPYAMKSMIGHMKNYLRDKSWYIQVPRRIKEMSLVVQHAIDELTSKLERSPNIEEIAGHLDIGVEETTEILAGRELYHYTSLDTPTTDDDNPAMLGDLIGAPADDFANVESRLDLQEALEKLHPEESKVLRLVFVTGLSQRAIADELGVSQMSISRIQKRALDKLRKLIKPPE